MSCTALFLNVRTSGQIYLDANLPQCLRCGNSFLALGQGSRRKACFERY